METNHSTGSGGVVPAASQRTLNAFKLRKKADCYLQRFLKFSQVATCHSYSELLYLALLEGDSEVSTFTPQPKPFLISGIKYFPDCFYIRSGKRFFVELKPQGVFTDSKKIPMEEYGGKNDFEFLVISNEEIMRQKIKADNWLRIVRVLMSSAYENTEGEELEIVQRLHFEPSLKLFEIVDAGARIERRFTEIALFRLAHKGIISIDLNTQSINPTTEVTLCD